MGGVRQELGREGARIRDGLLSPRAALPKPHSRPVFESGRKLGFHAPVQVSYACVYSLSPWRINSAAAAGMKRPKLLESVFETVIQN